MAASTQNKLYVLGQLYHREDDGDYEIGFNRRTPLKIAESSWESHTPNALHWPRGDTRTVAIATVPDGRYLHPVPHDQFATQDHHDDDLGILRTMDHIPVDHAKAAEALLRIDQLNVNVDPTPSQVEIAAECVRIGAALLAKNRRYGDSALTPKRVFSKADPIEGINVRLDDKLSRLESAQDDDKEDTLFDLLGYLVLRRVARTLATD